MSVGAVLALYVGMSWALRTSEVLSLWTGAGILAVVIVIAGAVYLPQQNTLPAWRALVTKNSVGILLLCAFCVTAAVAGLLQPLSIGLAVGCFGYGAVRFGQVRQELLASQVRTV